MVVKSRRCQGNSMTAISQASHSLCGVHLFPTQSPFYQHVLIEGCPNVLLYSALSPSTWMIQRKLTHLLSLWLFCSTAFSELTAKGCVGELKAKPEDISCPGGYSLGKVTGKQNVVGHSIFSKSLTMWIIVLLNSWYGFIQRVWLLTDKGTLHVNR